MQKEDRLKNVIIELGLKIPEVAQALGYSRPNSIYDNLRKNAATTKFVKLFTAHYGVNEDWINTGNGPKYNDVGLRLLQAINERNAAFEQRTGFKLKPGNKPEAEAIGAITGGQIEKDKSGNEFIDLKGGQYLMIVPLVEEYAQAGYVSGFADQSFIEDLPKHSIIVQQRHRGDYVAFRISGDSMDDESYRAIRDGDIAVGRKIDKIHWQSRFHLHKFTDYIIVHKEGIIIKSIAYHDVEKGTILCESRNPDKTRYPNYEINLSEVNEILNVVSIDRPWK